MTYSSGGLIQASDYNTLAWGSTGGGTYVDSDNLAFVWGTGSGRFGYGQNTSAFTQVSSAATVTAAQWTGLLGTMTTAKNHNGASFGTMDSSVTAGTVITYINTVTGNMTNLKAATGTSAGALSDSAATAATGPASWNTSTTATHTVTFASADAARYFFNAGGQIKLTFSIAAAGSTRNAEWNDTAVKCGTVIFGYRNTTQSPGAGAPAPNVLLNANNGGYWNTNTTGVVHFRQYSDSAPYTTDYIQVTATWGGSASNGGYSTITFTTLWSNAYSNVFQQTVTQSAVTNLVVSSPPTTYLTNTWGTPTVAQSATGS